MKKQFLTFALLTTMVAGGAVAQSGPYFLFGEEEAFFCPVGEATCDLIVNETIAYEEPESGVQDFTTEVDLTTIDAQLP